MKRFLFVSCLAIAGWVIFLSLVIKSGREAQKAQSAAKAAATGVAPARRAVAADPLEKKLSALSNTATSQVEGAKDFSFAEESKEVQELAKKLPQSKPEMMAIITGKDVFKAGEKKIREHTIDEITQNQMGAVKVMALRALVEKEDDPDVVRRDLSQVIQTAQDPTIVKIATAARDSLDKGRPFFKDFIAGLGGMHL